MVIGDALKLFEEHTLGSRTCLKCSSIFGSGGYAFSIIKLSHHLVFALCDTCAPKENETVCVATKVEIVEGIAADDAVYLSKVEDDGIGSISDSIEEARRRASQSQATGR
jgi:hypothetical protein